MQPAAWRLSLTVVALATGAPRAGPERADVTMLRGLSDPQVAHGAATASVQTSPGGNR